MADEVKALAPWLVVLAVALGGCGDDGTSAPCPAGTHDADGLEPGCEPWTDCPAGTRVSATGSATSDRACEPCAEGTFSPETNAAACAAHRSCGPGTRRVADGSATADTECASCATGTYTAEPDQPRCTPWSDCAPGQLVAREGFVTADRECAPCPAGSFSTETNAEECEPWMACAPWLEVATEGTASSDRTCRPWVRQFGTGEDDEVTDMLVDDDGSVFVVGTTAGTIPGQTSAGGDDGFVQRRDAEGAVLWTTQLGTDRDDSLTTVTLDSFGHVVVGGTTAGAFEGESARGLTDAFAAQLDQATGALRWVRQVGTAEAEAGSAAVDASGRVFVAGGTRGTLPGQTNAGETDAFFRAYDIDGNELSTVQLGNAADERVFDVAIDEAGALYLVGEVFGTSWDAFVWKVQPDGTVDWMRELDSGADDGAYRVVVDASGPVAAGYTTGTFPDETHGGATDVVVWSLDGSGTTRWVRQVGSSLDEWAANLTLTGDGEVVVVGATPGELPGQTTFGGTDGFAHRFDVEGTDRWTRQFGSAASDGVLAVAAGTASYLLIAGRTRGTLPGQTPLGGADAFLARLDP